jgi:hypothetical protein
MMFPPLFIIVIPGRAKREPGISIHYLQIPGSRLRLAPE